MTHIDRQAEFYQGTHSVSLDKLQEYVAQIEAEIEPSHQKALARTSTEMNALKRSLNPRYIRVVQKGHDIETKITPRAFNFLLTLTIDEAYQCGLLRPARAGSNGVGIRSWRVLHTAARRMLNQQGFQ